MTVLCKSFGYPQRMANRKRHHRTRSSWLLAQTGGAPHWMIAAAVVVLVALAAVVATHSAEPAPAAAGTSTPFVMKKDTQVSALFVGDSYTAGAGATTRENGWVTLVTAKLGWIQQNVAVGGMGYDSIAKCSGGCGDGYSAQLKRAAEEYSPTYVFINGGRNNAGVPGLSAGVEDAFSRAKRLFPHSRIYVTSPIWDDDPAPANLKKIQSVVKKQAAAAGITYIDLGEPLAGHPGLIISDGVHPNNKGHAAIAAAFEKAWKLAH